MDDKRREFIEEQKTIEDAAESLRAFVTGDGSPVDANHQSERLQNLLERVGAEFTAAERESILGAIERLNACEDGEINAPACTFCADNLARISGSR